MWWLKIATVLLFSLILWVNRGLTRSCFCLSCLESLLRIQVDGSRGWNVRESFTHMAGSLAEMAGRPGLLFPHHLFRWLPGVLHMAAGSQGPTAQDKPFYADSCQAFVGIVAAYLYFLGSESVLAGPPQRCGHWSHGLLRATKVNAYLAIRRRAAPKAPTWLLPLQYLLAWKPRNKYGRSANYQACLSRKLTSG